MADNEPAGASGSAAANRAQRGNAPDGPDLTVALVLAVAIVAVPTVVLGVVVFALLPVPWWIGVVIGLMVAAAVVWLRLRTADRIVLSGVGGDLLHADGRVRLENLVDSLSLAGGVERPDVVVLSDRARNAMAVRAGGRNHLVVTQGLLESLEVVELEGVVAELLTRLRNGDAESATVGAALFGFPILDGPLRPLLGPVARLGLGRLLREDRDLEADRQAVTLTRYPPGLLGALKTIADGEVQPAASTGGLAPLWLVDPHAGRSEHVDRDRAPLGLRIDVLAEL